MKFEATCLPGIIKIIPAVHEDSRGFFMETWQANKFADGGIDASFVQENYSRSSRNTLRGLHYQVTAPQGRLVRVVEGAVFDVSVDLRRGSPNFGRWIGEVLSAENRHQLWVPPGFAHGFLALTDVAGFQYLCTELYAPEHDRSIRWDDPDIAIDWPLPEGSEPILSEKDIAAPYFKDAETYP